MKQFVFLMVIAIAVLGSCEKQNEYERWVSKELDKGVQRDSLFLGYHFGMSRQEFYDHSWKLNDQKKVMQGEANQSVRYDVKELDHKAKMNFYPQFYKDKIYVMPVQYSYTGWAPWNKDLWSDHLLTDLVELYEKKYNTDFRKMEHPDLQRQAYISIQGNRSIAMFKEGDQHVVVTFTDLNVREQLKKEGEHVRK